MAFPHKLQVHAHIISYLKQEMPSVFRKDNKKKNLIYQLPVIFSKIQLQHNISAGDFPDCAKMQVGLIWPFSFFTPGECLFEKGFTPIYSFLIHKHPFCPSRSN